MTPEETAKDCLNYRADVSVYELMSRVPQNMRCRIDAEERVAAAIRDAVAQEREACAKVAEDDCRPGFVSLTLTASSPIEEWVSQSNGRTAHRIAAAIRRRS